MRQARDPALGEIEALPTSLCANHAIENVDSRRPAAMDVIDLLTYRAALPPPFTTIG